MIQDLLDFLITEIRGSWRYRWTAMLIAWVVCLIGWLYIFSLPNIFEARAQVFVDADSRLADVMGDVGVAPGVGSRVFVVRQAMLGRLQLEKVARETDLDLRAKTHEEMEELMFALRENIGVSSGRREEARNLYTITFKDRDRQMAVSVVQNLLDTFVEDVLELKKTGVAEVNNYLDSQLSHYSGLLSAAETGLADFKKQYVGLLPGENGGIFERLQTELDALKSLRSDLRIEEDRRIELRRQLQGETPYVPNDAMTPGVTVPGNPTDAAIKELESRRSQLLLTYTDKHPDVIATNEQLAQLYKAQEEARAALAGGGNGIEGAANANNPVYQNVQIALNDAGVRIATLSSRIAQREAVVQQLQGQVNTMPEVEAKYAELTRNYAQYRTLYNELLMRKERERMGTVGEDKDVVSFNVIEPPAATIEPVAPKRGLLIVATLIVGLGLGAAVAFLLHQLNPVFHSPRALRAITGRPVLGVVSLTWLERNQVRRKIDFSTLAIACTSLFIVFAVVMILQDQLVDIVGTVLTTAKG